MRRQVLAAKEDIPVKYSLLSQGPSFLFFRTFPATFPAIFVASGPLRNYLNSGGPPTSRHSRAARNRRLTLSAEGRLESIAGFEVVSATTTNTLETRHRAWQEESAIKTRFCHTPLITSLSAHPAHVERCPFTPHIIRQFSSGPTSKNLGNRTRLLTRVFQKVPLPPREG